MTPRWTQTSGPCRCSPQTKTKTNKKRCLEYRQHPDTTHRSGVQPHTLRYPDSCRCPPPTHSLHHMFSNVLHCDRMRRTLNCALPENCAVIQHAIMHTLPDQVKLISVVITDAFGFTLRLRLTYASAPYRATRRPIILLLTVFQCWPTAVCGDLLVSHSLSHYLTVFCCILRSVYFRCYVG